MIEKSLEEKILKFWAAPSGQKPENDNEFIDLFIAWLDKEFDDLALEYKGDGYYFGKVISILPDVRYYLPTVSFEIAYDYNNISIYSANHNGFWVPEYICINNQHPMFLDLRTAIVKFIKLKMLI